MCKILQLNPFFVIRRGVRTFHPMQFQPLLFQLHTISTQYNNFNPLQFNPILLMFCKALFIYGKTCYDNWVSGHFTPKTFHPRTFHPGTFHPKDISPRRHFTPRTFHPTDISRHVRFTPLFEKRIQRAKRNEKKEQLLRN